MTPEAAPPDPVDEMADVLARTLHANALVLTSSRGGYMGGGQQHATLESDPGAVEAIARGLLARRVAEPSREAEAAAGTALDVERLAEAIRDALENEFGGVLSIHYDGVLGMKLLPAAKALAPAIARQYRARLAGVEHE